VKLRQEALESPELVCAAEKYTSWNTVDKSGKSGYGGARVNPSHNHDRVSVEDRRIMIVIILI
jgi:hypothetical protein